MTRPCLIAVLLAGSAAVAHETPPESAMTPRTFSTWSLSIGGGALAMPSRPGAASLMVMPIPFLDVQYRQVAFLSPVTGLGVNALATQRAKLSLAVLPDFGRSTSSADRARGWGDISPGATLKLSAMYSLGRIALLADVRRQLGAANGTLVGAGVSSTVPIARHLILSGTAVVDWANARYMRAYFGVDPAAAPGQSLTAYTAGAGLRDAAFTAVAIVPIDERWMVQSLLRAEVLLGDAAQSPVTERRLQPMFGSFVAYRL
jgi:outer membrane scaffolding protein for murein synthesis (MipA/OmpV family)